MSPTAVDGPGLGFGTLAPVWLVKITPVTTSVSCLSLPETTPIVSVSAQKPWVGGLPQGPKLVTIVAVVAMMVKVEPCTCQRPTKGAPAVAVGDEVAVELLLGPALVELEVEPVLALSVEQAARAATIIAAPAMAAANPGVAVLLRTLCISTWHRPRKSVGLTVVGC